MAENNARDGGQTGRDERLKAALKANLARRKAQARARQDPKAKDPARADQEQE